MYYEQEDIQMFHGDCLEIMPSITEPVDAIIADPPYGGKTNAEWDVVIPLEPMWTNYKRLITQRGAMVIFGKPPFSSRLIISNEEQYRYTVYLEKPKGSNITQTAYRPLQVVEEILIFSSSPAVFSNVPAMIFNPQKTKREKPYYRTFKNGHQAVSKKHDGFTPRNPERLIGTRYYDSHHPRNLIYFSLDGDITTGHPTQKPEALMQYLIRTYTNPGDLVLDNTAGSFTTGVACIKEGRRFIGIEKEEKWCRVGKERIIKALVERGNIQAAKDTNKSYQIGFSI